MSVDKEINFRLRLDLGNDAMRTPADIARALRETADQIDQSSNLYGIAHYQNIRDDNGNTIGQYAVKNQDGDTPALHHLEAIEAGREW